MNKYCRHCAFCFEGDTFYCSERDKVLTETAIKRLNHCKDFAFHEEDIITGKRYKPHKQKEDDGKQLILEEL